MFVNKDVRIPGPNLMKFNFSNSSLIFIFQSVVLKFEASVPQQIVCSDVAKIH